jgi:mannan endo-1,4-beta-mannosidase
VKWANGQYHEQFYTDSTIRQWYKDWIAHLLNHVNPYNGVAYKDDPTIMLWELANEPRCTGSGTSGGGYPTQSCTTATIISWIRDVAPYVKGIDRHHLVSVGDEGFYCNPSSTNWIENCSQGVDTIAFAQSPGIDAMGFHLYPEGWGQTTVWADNYVTQHIADARRLEKPAYLGEFGLLSGNTRNGVYKAWTDLILTHHGAGGLFWDLALGKPGPNAAESDNSFDLYEGAPLLNTIHNYSQMMAANTVLPFGPVADDIWVTTPFDEPVTLTPIPNDVAYASATIDPATIDLDPVTPGQQTSIHVYGGTFLATGANVLFTPDAGFNGLSQASYSVSDSTGKLSNTAYLNVTVKPSQGGALTIESFETGVDGWAALSANAATLSQVTTFHTDGSYSLQANVSSGTWVGVSFAAPLDLSGRPSISVDVAAMSVGDGTAIAFQSGSSYTWCQTADPWPSLSTNATTTVTIPLDATKLNCGGGTPDLTQIHTFFVFLSGPGTYYLDNVRAGAGTNPNVPVILQSFETGTAGWHPLNGTGTVAQESAFHTDGPNGLQINSTDDWFGTNLSSPLDLTGHNSIQFDLQTLATGTSANVAIQTGSAWTWCQGNSFPYTTAGTTTTISVDFTAMSCTPDLSQIHAIWLYFNAGTVNIDDLRAQ